VASLKLYSFDPIADKDARILILGTLPSAASLEAGYNYGHPRNAFWYIMQTLLLGCPPEIDPAKLLPIEERKQLLISHGVALWDSLHSAARPGSSLDSAIDTATETPNDIPGFLRDHLQIRAVFFNGTKSESVFKRLIAPHIAADLELSAELATRPIVFKRLPSTSPANASVSLDKKLAAWREIISI
jgi:hypoxanthine-DNA glycosylase